MGYKILIVLAGIFVLFGTGCERKPFVEHKVKIERTGQDCSKLQTNFRLNSNFGGERYEFEKCLPDGFDDSSVRSERNGDTVVVRFAKTAAPGPAGVCRITLDIDSYPAYHFVTIDDDTYSIKPAEK